MRLDLIIQQLKNGGTRFGEYFGGAMELETVMTHSYSVQNEVAFVIPLTESATENKNENILRQEVTERFAVVVAIKNDNRTNDKKGMNAYNNLHFVRQEIFKAILGYRPSIEWEQPVTYRGGNLVGLNRGYLWYQYEFELIVSVEHRFDESDLAGNTGVDGIPVDMSQIDDFNTMFIDYVLSKTLKSEAAKDLDLPLDSDDTHAQQRIDFRESPNSGSFNISLGSGFDFYKGD